MPAIPIHTEMSVVIPKGCKRQFRRVISPLAHKVQVMAWNKRYKHRHFTVSAHRRYKHQPRDVRYNERKRRAYPHHAGIDLVYTGQSRDTLLAQQGDPKGYPSRGTLRYTSPSYFTMRPWRRHGPAKGEELTRLTPTEAKLLTRLFNDTAVKELDKYTKKKRRKRRRAR